MRCRPTKWILPAILGAGLPFLGAWFWNGASLDTKLAEGVSTNLASVGADWAKVSFDGRDAVLAGEGPSDEALAAASQSVSGTYGVRRVDSSGLKIAPALAAPTVSDPSAPIKGTWPESPGASLAVTLGGSRFVLGTDPNLTSDGSGNWSLVPPQGTADGSLDITAEVTDVFKRVVNSGAPAKWLIDRVAPAAPSIAAFVGKTAPETIGGSWAEGDASSLKVTLADKAYVLGTDKELVTDKGKWTLPVPAGLKDGSYAVTVETADAAGNKASANIPNAIIVDGIAPPPPTVTTLNSSQPVKQLSGTWAEGDAATLRVTVDDSVYQRGTYLGLRSQGKGKWILDLPLPLPEGSHKVTVENIDAAGNSAVAVQEDAVVIDTRPSASPTVDPVLSSESVKTVTGTWDNSDAKSLSVTADGSTYAKGVYSGLTTAGNKWRLDLATPLADGTHTISVKTADAAGNTSSGVTAGAILVDSTPPAPPTVDSILSGQPVTAVTGTYDSKETKSLNVTVGGSTYGLGTYLGLRTANGKWMLSPANPLGEGRYDVTVELADAVGNVASAKAAGAIVVDMTPPAPPTVDKVSATSPVKAITGSWDEADAHSLKVIVDGSAYGLRTYTGLTSSAGKWSLTPATPLDSGAHDVTVESADAAGNVSRSETSGAIVVGAASAVPTVAVSAGNNPSPEIAGTFDAHAKSLAVAVGGKVYVSGKDAALVMDASGKWTLTPDPLKDGIYDVVAVSTDAAGNRTSDETVGEVTVDLTPPSVPTVDIFADNNPSPVVNGSFDKSAKSLAVALNGKVYVMGKDANLRTTPEGLWSLTPDAPLTEGNYDVVVVTADEWGNKSSDVTVAEITVDLTGPVAPTVNKSEGSNPQPTITGTMGPGTRTLAVSIGGKVYVLSKDDSLTTDGNGNWTLKLPEPLKEGIYDVVAVTADVYDNRTSDDSVGEVTVDLTPPEPPTVDIIADNNPLPTISGNMARDAKSLAVAVNGKVYVLGTDAGLSATPGGPWSLKLDTPLPEGNFDIVAVTADASGNRSSDQTVAEVTVDLTGPKTPTVNKLSSSDPKPAITGSMPVDAKSFAVSIAGKVYVLGKDSGLTVDAGGNWTLTPPDPLSVGTYDIVAVAADTYDNRTSDETVGEVEITAAATMLPTVNAQESTVPRPAVTGTWNEASGSGLKVTLNGATYVLGTDEALTSDGKGAWSLAVPAPLKDGIYDVVAEASGKDGASSADATTNELAIDAAGPASPTVHLYSGEKSPSEISGTWAEGDATSLAVTLDGRTSALGQDAALSSDGIGNWTLQLGSALPAGSYDVVAANADKLGRSSTDQTKFEVLVKAMETAQPVPQPPALNCGAELAKLLIVSPLIFDSAKSKIRSSDQATVEKAAQLINGCTGLNFEIAGHTDSKASSPYNQALSERRAVSVRRALATAGVDPARLSAVGYGETKPLASNETDEGKSLNRRIEITVVK